MASLALADVVPLSLTTLTFPSFHPFAGQTGIVNAFAIRHADGIVLVDTGIGEGNTFIEKSYRPQRSAIADELRTAGLDITEVVAVINGHLHFDNIGGNALFPGIPIFVQQTEWDAAHAGGETYRNERVAFDVLDWIDFPGATYRVVDGEHEVVAGVRLFPTPGRFPTPTWSGSGFASNARCTTVPSRTSWSVIPTLTSPRPSASSTSDPVAFTSLTTPSRGDEGPNSA